MAELWLRVVALHDADASSSFEQPPANLVVWAFAVHAAQCQKTSQLSCSSRHLTRLPAPCCSSRMSRMGAVVLLQLPEHALSVPAFRLASPRFCTVTFCARLSLRLGMLFRFFCWRLSMLLGAVRYALHPAAVLCTAPGIYVTECFRVRCVPLVPRAHIVAGVMTPTTSALISSCSSSASGCSSRRGFWL